MGYSGSFIVLVANQGTYNQQINETFKNFILKVPHAQTQRLKQFSPNDIWLRGIHVLIQYSQIY